MPDKKGTKQVTANKKSIARVLCRGLQTEFEAEHREAVGTEVKSIRQDADQPQVSYCALFKTAGLLCRGHA